jgi:hypothetical protein
MSNAALTTDPIAETLAALRSRLSRSQPNHALGAEAGSAAI